MGSTNDSNESGVLFEINPVDTTNNLSKGLEILAMESGENTQSDLLKILSENASLGTFIGMRNDFAKGQVNIQQTYPSLKEIVALFNMDFQKIAPFFFDDNNDFWRLLCYYIAVKNNDDAWEWEGTDLNLIFKNIEGLKEGLDTLQKEILDALVLIANIRDTDFLGNYDDDEIKNYFNELAKLDNNLLDKIIAAKLIPDELIETIVDYGTFKKFEYYQQRAIVKHYPETSEKLFLTKVKQMRSFTDGYEDTTAKNINAKIEEFKPWSGFIDLYTIQQEKAMEEKYKQQ